MKKKIKKILKNRIFLCLLTAIIVGTVSVSAATYFPSNDVTYDNKESGLASTNVQGAIDELYNACKTPATGGGSILDKVDIVTSGDGLYKDEYEEGRYFYKGGNPNNYITFNNEKAGWRIISIEPDNAIKIVRTQSIGDMAWSSENSIKWNYPTSLNIYLNGTYYNKLDNANRSKIVASNFSIGGVTLNSAMDAQIEAENSVKWYGNIALPTLSEYIRTNSDKNNCGTNSLNNNNSNCTSTGWMDNVSGWTGWWTLTPDLSHSSVFEINWTGQSTYPSPNQSYMIRPAIYLSSNIKITSGTGTSQDPYQISL